MKQFIFVFLMQLAALSQAHARMTYMSCTASFRGTPFTDGRQVPFNGSTNIEATLSGRCEDALRQCVQQMSYSVGQRQAAYGCRVSDQNYGDFTPTGNHIGENICRYDYWMCRR